MPKKIHLVAGMLATLCIATFFLASLGSELFGSHETVAMVNAWIVLPGLFILVPAIAATGGTGMFLAKSRQGRLVEAKKKRMPFIAANGILIMIPCAIFSIAGRLPGPLTPLFTRCRRLELVVGAVNFVLLGKNMADGMKMSGRFRPAPKITR